MKRDKTYDNFIGIILHIGYNLCIIDDELCKNFTLFENCISCMSYNVYKYISYKRKIDFEINENEFFVIKNCLVIPVWFGLLL